jgi:hypothetical protein
VVVLFLELLLRFFNIISLLLFRFLFMNPSIKLNLSLVLKNSF